MGDCHHGLSLLAHQPFQDLEHLFRALAVEAAGWFVGEDQWRIVGQRAGHGHALSLAAGELVWPFVEMIGKAECRKQFACPLAHLVPAKTAEPAHGDLDILSGGEFRQQEVELKDEADIGKACSGSFVLIHQVRVPVANGERAAGRPVKQAEQVKQRRFAGAGRSSDGDELALADNERYILDQGDRDRLLEDACEALCFDERAHVAP